MNSCLEISDSYRNNCTGVGKKITPHKHTFDVELVFRQTYIPVQAFQTDTVKKRLSFINAENFKHVMILRHYFPVRLNTTFKLLGQHSAVNP